MNEKVSLNGLLKVLKRFPKSRVMVAGDIILDHFIWGKVRRISPEAPVPVVEVADMTFRLGGAANVAAGITALGGKADLVGIIGDGIYCAEIMRLLDEHGISAEGIIRQKGRPTTIKTRIIAHNQQVVRYDREVREEPSRTQLTKIRNWVEGRLGDVNAVVLSDYDKGMLKGRIGPEIIKAARKMGVAVTVDPKVPNISRFAGADVVTPNQLEAQQISGVEINSEKSLEKAGRGILKKYKMRALLVTRGEAGMSLFVPGKKTLHVSAVARQVFDVTGAGDTAIAAFTLAIAAGARPLQATWLANAAAAVTVRKIGTATVSASELEASLREELSAWLRRK